MSGEGYFVTACQSCGRTFAPDLACVWFDTPTCSTCCGCDDDEPTTPPTAALDRLRTGADRPRTGDHMNDDRRGIVLDETTAQIVPDIGRWIDGNGEEWGYIPEFECHVAPGDILTHIGGRPVADVVAAHDQATAHADALNALAAIAQLRAMDGDREVWEDCLAAADHFDHLADLLIAPELVAAWHAQHDGTAP